MDENGELNYDPNGLTLGSRLFHGGLKGRVFVDLSSGFRPYIPRGVDCLTDSLSIEYVGYGSSSDSQRVDLVSHLNDPEYDFSKFDRLRDTTRIVDLERLGSARLRRVGD